MVSPRGAWLCARGRARSPRPIDCLNHPLRKKSKSYQILVLLAQLQTQKYQESFLTPLATDQREIDRRVGPAWSEQSESKLTERRAEFGVKVVARRSGWRTDYRFRQAGRLPYKDRAFLRMINQISTNLRVG